jgi:hypothetical protein
MRSSDRAGKSGRKKSQTKVCLIRPDIANENVRTGRVNYASCDIVLRCHLRGYRHFGEDARWCDLDEGFLDEGVYEGRLADACIAAKNDPYFAAHKIPVSGETEGEGEGLEVRRIRVVSKGITEGVSEKSELLWMDRKVGVPAGQDSGTA